MKRFIERQKFNKERVASVWFLKSFIDLPIQLIDYNQLNVYKFITTTKINQ